MTDNNHLITAPDEFVEDWWQETQIVKPERWVRYLADRAAQWGYEQRGAVNEAELQKARDEELEACINWMIENRYWGEDGLAVASLRAARRPKPKSQAEEALVEIEEVEGAMYSAGLGCDFTATRAALERLRELAKQADD